MPEFEPTAFIEQALTAAARGLGPFVTKRFAEVTPGVSDWTQILAQKDRQAGRRVDRYNPRDLSLMLRVLTESLGSLGYPFTDLLDRQASNCASELRGARNKWAHREEFTVAETYRALDSAEILLRAVAADADADEVAALKVTVLAVMNSAVPVPQNAEDTTSAPDPALSRGEAPEPASEAVIKVAALGTLSYALARSATSVVTEIVLDYRGIELRGASIEIEVSSQLGPLGDESCLSTLTVRTRQYCGTSNCFLIPHACSRSSRRCPRE